MRVRPQFASVEAQASSDEWLLNQLVLVQKHLGWLELQITCAYLEMLIGISKIIIVEDFSDGLTKCLNIGAKCCLANFVDLGRYNRIQW